MVTLDCGLSSSMSADVTFVGGPSPSSGSPPVTESWFWRAVAEAEAEEEGMCAISASSIKSWSCLLSDVSA